MSLFPWRDCELVSIDFKNRENPPFLVVPHRPDRFQAMIPKSAKNVAAAKDSSNTRRNRRR